MIRVFAVCIALIATVTNASAFETKATAAFIMDQTSGTVLLTKNADQPLPPASMSKLMTLYMAFEAVRRGKAEGGLDLNEELPVSEHAQSYGGSSMFCARAKACASKTCYAVSSCYRVTMPVWSSQNRSRLMVRNTALPD